MSCACVLSSTDDEPSRLRWILALTQDKRKEKKGMERMDAG